MLMELYIYVVMGQSQFIVVLAFKLFSFQNDIFNAVIANYYNCTIVLTHVEKYTVGLDLPPQNVLCCVVCLARGNIRKQTCVYLFIYNSLPSLMMRKHTTV